MSLTKHIYFFISEMSIALYENEMHLASYNDYGKLIIQGLKHGVIIDSLAYKHIQIIKQNLMSILMLTESEAVQHIYTFFIGNYHQKLYDMTKTMLTLFSISNDNIFKYELI